MTDSLHVFAGRITRVREEPTGREGLVSVGGAGRWVVLDLVPEAQEGDTVLVHAGVALALVTDPDNAEPVAAGSLASSPHVGRDREGGH